MHFNRRQNTRNSFFALGLWLVCSLGVGFGAYQYLHSSAVAVREAAFQRAEAEAAVAEQTLLRTIEAIQSVMDLLALRQRLIDEQNEGGAKAIEQQVRAMAVAQRFGIVQASLTDGNGRVSWGTALDAAGVSIADREHFRVHFRDERPALFLSAPVIGRTTGRWSLQASRRLENARGELAGIIVVSLDPLVLSAMLEAQAPEEGAMLVIRKRTDGALLARNHAVVDSLADGSVPTHPILSRLGSALHARIEGNYIYQGREKLVAYRAPAGLPVVVYAALDREVEMAKFWRLATSVIAASVLAIVSGLAVTIAWDRNTLLRQQLHIEATSDPLTGLHNRRAIEATIPGALAVARDRQEPLAFMLFDLDHFKSINDRYSHAIGDAVLVDVAQVLVQQVRTHDMVCRWGGEEILVVLRDCGVEDAARRAEELRIKIASLYEGGQGPVDRVTTSIGVASFPGCGDTLDAMVRCADHALYMAKAQGRNRVALASQLDSDRLVEPPETVA